MAQEVEHLPSKSEALSSNPITAKRKKKKIAKIVKRVLIYPLPIFCLVLTLFITVVCFSELRNQHWCLKILNSRLFSDFANFSTSDIFLFQHYPALYFQDQPGCCMAIENQPGSSSSIPVER
jgi:hypothetical protein